jgi:hypothetical protein
VKGMNFRDQISQFIGWKIRFVVDGTQGLIIAGMSAMKLEGILQEVGSDYIKVLVKNKLETYIPFTNLSAFIPLEKGKR